MMMLLVVTTPGLTQTRDYWLKMERKGTGFGYEHITVRKLKNGNWEYQIDQRQKTDVAGFNQQDIIYLFTCVVDSNFQPISFVLQTRSALKNLKTTGKYIDGRMNLISEDNGREIGRQEIAFKNTYFDVTLPDLILKRESDRLFNLKIFNSLSLNIDSVQVEVTKSNAAWVEATVIDDITKKYRIDRQGKIKQVIFVEIGIWEYLTNAKNAQNITYLNTADGLNWMVRSKRSFPNVFKIARAQIQVKWRNIPFEKFSFEDNRQQILREKSVHDKYEVVLEIKKKTPASNGIIAPVIDEKFSLYLQDTKFIKPGDPFIQKKMTEIIENEKDAFTIVQKILHWVSNNIKTEFIAETLTGPEVLEQKGGKSAEFAVAFASLSRAAGIPTKIVLGEANKGNLWVGHIWNEVWLGEWMAVEPGSGMFITGPSHLKFVDSPTVLGAQSLRLKLIDNLGVEILDFEEEEIAITTEVETGIISDTYFNKVFTCKISIPDSTWDIEEAADAGQTSIKIRPKVNKNIMFALVLFAVPPGMSAENILTGRMNVLSGMLKNFQKLNHGYIEIAKQKAPKVVYQQAANDSLILLNENYLLVDGTNAYLFASIAPKDHFENFKVDFQKILESFEILK